MAADGLEQKRALTKRRRELLDNKPDRYCPHCTVLVYAQDERCLECGQERPERGWPDLRDSMDPWLGRALEGRYLLTKRVGQGASASVYRAESMAISRQFAIKLINPPRGSGGPSAEQIAARLEREIEALGRLRNPHVVRFYDVVELPLNHIGVVMDFVEGETLEREVERCGPMSVARACSLLRQIANGVYEAHLVGMTHRDLKPENIMIEQLPAGDDFVHVLDFGIVHMEGEANMTQGFIGTPLYASPEQAMGEEVDHRSDIYSLGAISFFMLCGFPPFVGQNVMQVLRQHVEEPPPPISTYRRDQGVPEELELLIRRMLAKSPGDRPQSLSEVIHQLDRLSYATSEGKETVEEDQAQLVAETLGGAVKESRREAPSSPLSEQSPPPAAIGRSGTAGTSPGLPLRDDMPEEHSETLPHLVDGKISTDIPGGGLPQHSTPILVEEGVAPPQREGEEGYARPTPSSGIFGKMRRPRSSGRVESPKADAGASSGGALPAVHTPASPELGELLLSEYGAPTRVAVGPGHCVLTLEEDELKLWRFQPRQRKSFPVHDSRQVSALALSKEAALIGRDTGVIELLDLKTGHIQVLFSSVFSDSVRALALSSDAQTLIALMSSGRIYISGSGRANDDWVRVRGGAPGCAINLSSKNDLFAVAREDNQIEISRLSEPKSVRIRIEAREPVHHLAFSEDGYLLGVCGHLSDHVSLYQVINGKHFIDVGAKGHQLLAFSFSNENALLGYLLQEDRLSVGDIQALQIAVEPR